VAVKLMQIYSMMSFFVLSFYVHALIDQYLLLLKCPTAIKDFALVLWSTLIKCR